MFDLKSAQMFELPFKVAKYPLWPEGYTISSLLRAKSFLAITHSQLWDSGCAGLFKKDMLAILDKQV